MSQALLPAPFVFSLRRMIYCEWHRSEFCRTTSIKQCCVKTPSFVLSLSTKRKKCSALSCKRMNEAAPAGCSLGFCHVYVHFSNSTHTCTPPPYIHSLLVQPLELCFSWGYPNAKPSFVMMEGVPTAWTDIVVTVNYTEHTGSARSLLLWQ